MHAQHYKLATSAVRHNSRKPRENNRTETESWSDGRDMRILLKLVLVIVVIKQLGPVVQSGVKVTKG